MKEINELKKENFDMGRIAKGGYIQNGKAHYFRNLIMDADKWLQDKEAFLRTFYGCVTMVSNSYQSIQLKAYRKAEGRKKEIFIIFFLDIIENSDRERK